MKIRKRWTVGILAGVLGFVLGIGAAVIAGTSVSSQANSLAVVKTLATVADRTTTSSSYVDASGLARIATSTATSNVFLFRLSAETSCDVEGEVRIQVYDNANSPIGTMIPAEDNFDFCNDPPDNEDAHAMERTISGLAPGTYRFQVQFRSPSGGTDEFTIEESLLVLERYV